MHLLNLLTFFSKLMTGLFFLHFYTYVKYLQNCLVFLGLFLPFLYRFRSENPHFLITQKRQHFQLCNFFLKPTDNGQDENNFFELITVSGFFSFLFVYEVHRLNTYLMQLFSIYQLLMNFNTGFLSSACFMNIDSFARYKYHLLLSYTTNDFYLYPNYVTNRP